MKHVFSVSGGKDSTVLLLLGIERGIEPIAVFADTGHEHPWTYDYIDYLQKATGVPIRTVKADFSQRIAEKRRFIANDQRTSRDDKGRRRRWTNKSKRRALEVLHPTGNPFLDLCLWKGRFPSSKARFCTEELKVLPITEQVVLPLLKQGHEVQSWQGIRWDESPDRAKMAEFEEADLGIVVYRPILSWTARDVFAFHDRHGIKPNPLYLHGMGRVGCMPCINCRKGELNEIAARFPGEIERVREWERLVGRASKRGSSTLFTAVSAGSGSSERITPETHGIDYAVEWSRTARGGRQFDLLQSAPKSACSSIYGLCEAAA